MTSSSSWMLIHSRPPDKDERLFFTLAQKARQQISACRSLRQFITGFQVCAGSLFQNKGDLPQLRRMAYLLQNCSNNLNQVAKRANESGQLYAADLEDLRSRLDELIAIGKQLLDKLTEL